jgi:hypothetical protein
MTTDDEDALPYLDEHRITIAAPRDVVWTQLCRYAEHAIGFPPHNLVARLLGTEPRGGFAVTPDEAEHRIRLAGRHRFSRYLLVLELTDGPAGQTVLTAKSRAAFPGPHGFVYRTLVVGSRGHVVVVGHMLRAVRDRSLR